MYIAIEKNLCPKYGVQIKMLGDVIAGPTALQAVAANTANAGLSSVPAIINAVQAGLPVQGVVDIQTSIADDNQSLQKWYVRADSNINSIADLKGKTVAINLVKSSFNYTLWMALEQAGLKDTDITTSLLSFDKQITALDQKQVDAIGLMVPYQGQAEQQYPGKFRVLFTDLDIFKQTRHVSLIFVNRIWAEDHPQLAQSFTTCVADAINWIEKNQAEAKTIVAKYTGLKSEYVPDYHFTPNGQVRMDDVQFWMDYLKQRGDLTASWVKPENVATNQYNLYVTK